MIPRIRMTCRARPHIAHWCRRDFSPLQSVFPPTMRGARSQVESQPGQGHRATLVRINMRMGWRLMLLLNRQQTTGRYAAVHFEQMARTFGSTGGARQPQSGQDQPVCTGHIMSW
eukprot:jgi/Ulvmu1/12099/UM084_0024.1